MGKNVCCNILSTVLHLNKERKTISPSHALGVVDRAEAEAEPEPDMAHRKEQ